MVLATTTEADTEPENSRSMKSNCGSLKTVRALLPVMSRMALCTGVGHVRIIIRINPGVPVIVRLLTSSRMRYSGPFGFDGSYYPPLPRCLMVVSETTPRIQSPTTSALQPVTFAEMVDIFAPQHAPHLYQFKKPHSLIQ
jgi:hypothetical protein